MNLSIVGKQFNLTDSIKQHIENAFDALNKYGLDIISGRCVVSADEKNGHKDKDLYAAVDLALERASKVLRREHDKNTTVKNKDDGKAVRASIADEQTSDGEVDEIIPMELELYKPLEIEEAMQKLKDSDAQFYVFNDMDAKMRVIYKRSDGKFGLY